jgi:hypothetical protein
MGLGGRGSKKNTLQKVQMAWQSCSALLDAYVLRTKHWRDTELGKEEDKLEKDLCQEATGTT